MQRHMLIAAFVTAALAGSMEARAAEASLADKNMALLDRYCSDCHNAIEFAGEVDFEYVDPHALDKDARIWEATVRKLRGRMMPPPGQKQPEQAEVDAFVTWAETSLDALAAAKPSPGHVGLKRLNRTEYGHAVEDLLGIKVDAATLLPKDIETEGFDNVAKALQVSPSFLDQYIAAAREISRQALGNPAAPRLSTVYRGSQDGQALHRDGLPLGTRGGLLIEHDFPADAEYAFDISLAVADIRMNPGYVSGLDHQHKVIMTLDGKRVFEEHVGGPDELKASDHDQQAANKARAERFSNIRLQVPAGPHRIGVTFVAKTFAESDDVLQPLSPGTGIERYPVVAAVEVLGPFNATGVSDTPSRQRIFSCRPRTPAEELTCATEIVTRLTRRAFRRPVTEAEVAGPLRFYTAARSTGDFDRGIESALTAILASPKFLYRAEPVPADAEPGSIHELTDLELASRLSFFLWSQGPDDELLEIAAYDKLKEPGTLEQQVKRMLADPRSESLVTNFADQWLRVGKINDNEPDPGLFPDFDPTLRPALRRETELFVDSILRSDRSVIELLTADHTFLNERLAVHYGMANIRGDQFRRVTLEDSNRWGLLGKGAMLMGTSYGNRTAPVLRGAWILENITGTPPHAPPPGVETLKENADGRKPETVRERLEAHRANPSCNACHGVMDPLGFALENFDATGKWRDKDRETITVIDSSGQLSDGTALNGPADLRNALIKRPEQFVQTLTEKLMIYGLGRTIEYHDMPVIRQIVRDAAQDQYRFSSIVLGIVNSPPFRLTQVPLDEATAKGEH